MGHMNKPLFDLDQPGLQAEVDSYKPGNGLIWPVLFPLKYTPKFDLKGIEGEDGIPVSADRVAFNTKAPLKSRKTVGSWSGQLSKISMSKEKTELEIGEYEDLKTIAAANTEDKQTARYLVDMVYDDVKACNDGADYKSKSTHAVSGREASRLSRRKSKEIWQPRTSSTSTYRRKTSLPPIFRGVNPVLTVLATSPSGRT